jgi:hypothetical protein
MFDDDIGSLCGRGVDRKIRLRSLDRDDGCCRMSSISAARPRAAPPSCSSRSTAMTAPGAREQQDEGQTIFLASATNQPTVPVVIILQVDSGGPREVRDGLVVGGVVAMKRSAPNWPRTLAPSVRARSVAPAAAPP